jgi:hypothetical protein
MTTAAAGACDATFDNYFATDIEPPRFTLVGSGFNSLRSHGPRPRHLQAQTSQSFPYDLTDYPEPPTNDDMGSVYIIADTTTGDKFYRLVA